MTDPLRDGLQRSLGTAYTIERELGGGAMSRVFVARDERLSRDVVVKVVSPSLAVELSAERFQREIALAARLQEPHIVPVLAAGETAEGLPYYTMPFVAGESLRARLGRGRPATGEALTILRDVACALAYAHEHGVVHRDIKPDNVLLSSGTAVVADFGIAKAISAARTTTVGPEDSGATLTRAGTSIGTPAYMSPEQATGEAVDGRSDVYAWGVLAYELLSGEHPFADRTTAPQLLSAHLTERPRPLASRAAGLSSAASALVMRALAKSPADRPTAAELVDGLTATSGGLSGGARRMALWGGAVALLVVAGAGAFALRSRARASAVVDASSPTSVPIASVAVMPFVNTGGDRSDDYFSDGLSDELAHALVRVPGLRVAGRASSNAFRGKSATAGEIGRALGVAAIVEGTVRRAGGRLRVTAQLTSTTDEHVLWTSEPFESRSADVFQVQDEFTSAVVTALAPALRGASVTSPVMATERRGTSDAEAYDLYLHGRYYWSRRGVANLDRAVDYFRQATAKDPNFARAHAGLALAYVVTPAFDVSAPSDSMYELGRISAERALALDPANGDAHLALANVRTRHLRLTDARRHFRAALSAEPLNATAHAWYADHLKYRGMLDSALVEKRRGVELEPLSALLTNQLAITLFEMNRLPEALDAAHRVAELDSSFTRGYHTLARIQIFRGFPDSALAALETAARLGPRLDGEHGLRVLAHAAAGRWPEARRLRDELLANPQLRRSHGDRMIAAMAFGDRAAAMDALEREVAALDLRTNPACNPVYESLKTEPRFLALMERFGIGVCPPRARWPVPAPPP